MIGYYFGRAQEAAERHPEEEENEPSGRKQI